ncbi:MAG: response regulator transcription factor [Ignavibacteriae bacterium]|nr:response regulator transcription factor [Ignavibacteriota bacterium]
MRKTHSILIIDDHPVIVEGYSNALKFGLDSEKVSIDSAHNCETAIEKLESNGQSYSLVILDISLPSFDIMKMNSGEDLGIWIRDKYPEIKILVITSHYDALRLNSISYNISPEGFLLKSEIDTSDLISAVKSISKGKVELGRRVSELLLQKAKSQIKIDNLSLKILTELSNGTRTKDLPKYIPLSKSGIEKRKRILKSYFNNETDTDRELIINAKKQGYL